MFILLATFKPYSLANNTHGHPPHLASSHCTQVVKLLLLLFFTSFAALVFLCIFFPFAGYASALCCLHTPVTRWGVTVVARSGCVGGWSITLDAALKFCFGIAVKLSV